MYVHTQMYIDKPQLYYNASHTLMLLLVTTLSTA